MYCSNCGRDAGQANFCPECGKNLFVATVVNPSSSVETFSPFTAYKSVFKKFGQFEGRSRRSEYWFAELANFIIIMSWFLINTILMVTAALSDMETLGVILLMTNGPIIFIYYVITFVPFLALSVRRLHDIGKSGWFLLLNLIPLVGGIIIFVFSVTDSQLGPNEYGPNPKGL